MTASRLHIDASRPGQGGSGSPVVNALKANGLVTVECEGTGPESGVDSLAGLRRTGVLSLLTYRGRWNAGF